LSLGRASAITSSMPTSAATARATVCLGRLPRGSQLLGEVSAPASASSHGRPARRICAEEFRHAGRLGRASSPDTARRSRGSTGRRTADRSEERRAAIRQPVPRGRLRDRLGRSAGARDRPSRRPCDPRRDGHRSRLGRGGVPPSPGLRGSRRSDSACQLNGVTPTPHPNYGVGATSVSPGSGGTSGDGARSCDACS
jgi:hypothetical protein